MRAGVAACSSRQSGQATAARQIRCVGGWRARCPRSVPAAWTQHIIWHRLSMFGVEQLQSPEVGQQRRSRMRPATWNGHRGQRYLQAARRCPTGLTSRASASAVALQLWYRSFPVIFQQGKWETGRMGEEEVAPIFFPRQVVSTILHVRHEHLPPLLLQKRARGSAEEESYSGKVTARVHAHGFGCLRGQARCDKQVPAPL